MTRMFQRKYEKKLLDRAVNIKENRKFLLERLKQEWKEIETAIEKDRKKKKLYETVRETGEVLGLTLLGMAAVCGILVVGAVAPNVFSAIGRLGGRRYFDKKSFRERVYYYNRRGYIKVKKDDKDGTMEIQLTDRGEKKLLGRSLMNLKVMPQEKWDGIWRIVIFDISEKNKWAREGVRECLKRMGFYPLQKSVFVTPHPCKQEIDFLIRLYDIYGHLRLIETRALSFDDDLREFFNI